MILVKVHDARLIPRELIEQVPFTNADEFYKTMREAWKYQNDFIYAMIDERYEIKGYVWYQVNLMDMSIFINAVSICEEWKNTGKVKELAELIKKDMVQMGLKKVFFLTDKPALYEKMGLVKTNSVLLMGDFEDGTK